MRHEARERATRLGAVLSIAAFSLVFFGTGLVGAGSLEAGVAGNWRLADDLSGAACRLALLDTVKAPDKASVKAPDKASVKAPGGSAEAKGCTRVLPGAEHVAAWRLLPEGGLELSSAAGARLAVFDVGELDGLALVEPAGLFLVMTPDHGLALSALIPGAR